MVLKSRPVVTMAGVSQILRGQDGRVVEAGALGGAHVKSWDQLPGRTSCLYTKNPKAGRLVLKSRPVVTMVGVSQILKEVRMAEWLWPGLWEVLMLSRGIEPGQVLIPKKSI